MYILGLFKGYCPSDSLGTFLIRYSNDVQHSSEVDKNQEMTKIMTVSYESKKQQVKKQHHLESRGHTRQ